MLVLKIFFEQDCLGSSSPKKADSETDVHTGSISGMPMTSSMPKGK